MKQSQFSLPGTPANVQDNNNNNNQQQTLLQLLSCLDVEETTCHALLLAVQQQLLTSNASSSLNNNLINGLVLFKSIRQRHKIDPIVQQLQGSSTKFWSPNCFKVVKNNIYRVRVYFDQKFFDNNLGVNAKLALVELLDKNLQPIGSTTTGKKNEAIERLTTVRNYEDDELTSKASHVLLDYCIRLNVVSTKNNGPFTLRFTFFSERYQQTWQISSVTFDVAARLKTQDKSRRGTRGSKSTSANSTPATINEESNSSSPRKRSRAEASATASTLPMQTVSSVEDFSTITAMMISTSDSEDTSPVEMYQQQQLDSQKIQFQQAFSPAIEYASSSSSSSPTQQEDSDMRSYLSTLLINNDDEQSIDAAQPKRQRTVSH